MSDGVTLSLFVLFGVHVVAFFVLFAALGGEMVEIFRAPKRDDGWGGGEDPPDEPVAPEPGGTGGLPLPDAEQAPVRLREPGRIGERYDRPVRRPAHAPQRVPAKR